MICRVAFVPAAPLIVEPIAPASAGLVEDFRAEALAVVQQLCADEPDRIVVIAEPTGADGDEESGADFASLGVSHRVGGPHLTLGVEHGIGAWLLDTVGWRGPRSYQSTASTTPVKTALLVVADGSAKRETFSPGYRDPRAEPYDQRIVAALESGDPQQLISLDAARGRELWVRGIQPLQVCGQMTSGARFDATVHREGAPLGIGMWVAQWTPQG